LPQSCCPARTAEAANIEHREDIRQRCSGGL
jgi:hypothetical protein